MGNGGLELGDELYFSASDQLQGGILERTGVMLYLDEGCRGVFQC